LAAIGLGSVKSVKKEGTGAMSILRTLAAVVLLAGNDLQAQTTKEYVYLGSRMFAIDTSTSAISITPNQWTLPQSGGNAELKVYANSGSSWTATTTASWLHFTGVTSGTGNGVITYSYDPLPNGVSTRSASILVGSLAEAITQIAAVASPTNVSATANPASGLDSTFTFSASSPGGPNYFNWIYVIINKTPSYTGACAFIYTQNDNTLYLDNGQGSWVGWGKVGSTDPPLISPFCQINLSEVSVTRDFTSNQLKLIPKIHFKLPGMGGPSVPI
jgi:hypothetical protein